MYLKVVTSNRIKPMLKPTDEQKQGIENVRKK